MANVSTARAIINPQIPCKMEGYNETRFTLFQKDADAENKDPMRTAEGIRDDLVLDTLYIEDNNGKAVVIHIPDIIMIDQEYGDRCKQALADHFKMKPEQFVISCSHTHASPLVSTGMYGNLEPDQAYLQLIINKMIENTAACMEQKQQAAVTHDQHPIEGYFCNRQGFDAAYYDKIDTLRFSSEEGYGIGKMLNLACHPTVLDNKNLYVSNDFFGVIRRYLQSSDGIPVMIANGEGGDVSTRLTKQAGDWNETIRIGEGIAAQMTAPNQQKALEIGAITITEVPYIVDYVPAEDAYLHAKKIELEEQLKQLDPASKEALLIDSCFLVDVNEKLALEHIHYEMSSFIYDFSSFRMVTFPGEIDSQLGKQLRSADDKPTFIIAYSNGFYYYAVNKDEYGSNHESFNSRFPYGAADAFVEKIIAQYQQSLVPNV